MQIFANNAFSTLAGAIAANATTMAVQPGQGARFPAPTGGDFFMLTLFQLIGGIESNHEIVMVTARSVDTLTIVRAQEGTTARAWGVGDQVSHRGTAGTLGGLAQLGAPAQFSQPVYAPTAAAGTNTTQAATTAFVTAAVQQAKADLVASSPAALDTLNELATALGNDPNFATTMSTSLGNRLRVDVNTQGLNATQKANAATNLGLATVATSGSKSDVGLSNVDNTSDANKPVSNAQAAALNLKAPLAAPSFTGGITSTSNNSAGLTTAGKDATYTGSDISINRSSSTANAAQGPCIQLNDGTTTNNWLLQAGAGAFQVFGYGTGTWTEKMRVANDGNVGIGVTPKPWGTATLQVKAVGITESSAGGEYAYNAYRIADGTWKAMATGGSARYGQAGDHRWYVGTANTDAPITWSQAMTLTSSGALGVGTTSPNSQFEIRKDDRANGPVITLNNRSNGGSDAGSYIVGGLWGAGFRDVRDPAYMAGIDFLREPASGGLASNGSIVFSAMQGGGTLAEARVAEVMRINSNGRVLIGTATDNGNGKLQIDGGSSGAVRLKSVYSYGENNYALKLDGDAGTPGGYLSQNPAAGGFQLSQGGTYYGGGASRADANSTTFASISGNGGTLLFCTNSGLTANGNFTAAERMRIADTGFIGVGTTAPSQYSHGGSAKLIEVCNSDTAQNSQGHIILSSAATSASSAIGAMTFAMPNVVTANKMMAYISSETATGHTPTVPASRLIFVTRNAGTLTEAMRLDDNSNLLVGVTSGSQHTISKNGAEGTVVLQVSSNQAGYAYFQSVANNSANGAATGMYIGRNSSTARSINAAGTINASGADYAEYMTKADTCGVLAKGQIVGVDAAGKLTDQWAAAVSFLVKSTDPSYVGGDVWGSEEALGMTRPEQPTFAAPLYTGSDKPSTVPVEPTAPAAEAPVEPTAPAGESTDEEVAAYQEACQAYRAALAAYAQVQLAYQAALSTYHMDKATYDAALAKYEVDQAAHDAAVAAARADFDNVTMATYQQQLDVFDAALEAARAKVDRIAYAGQVPVNVIGAWPGDYVVPVQNGEGIKGVLVNDADITFAQYRRTVGVVQNILPDGRANVRVKVA